MVGVESGEPSFSRKLIHDDFHRGGIPIEEVRERKDPFSFILVPWLDVWLIVMIFQVFFLEPLFTNIWNSSGNCYDGCGYCESYTSKGYMVVMKIRDENPAQIG